MKSTSEIAKSIIVALRLHGIAPRYTHTAAQGPNWGYVHAWAIDDDGTFAVAHGDCQTAHYDITMAAQDLDLFLVGDDADVVAICNLRDEEPEAIDDDHAGPCLIIQLRFCSDNVRIFSWVRDEHFKPARFTTTETARAWIHNHQNSPYYLDHNESRRPCFYVVAA